MRFWCAPTYLVSAPETTAYDMMVQIFDFVLQVMKRQGADWGQALSLLFKRGLAKR